MFKHILIPTDGSDLSRKAILYGVQLAKESGAKVTGLTVAEPYRAAAMDAVLVPVDEGDYEEQSRVLSEKAMEQVKKSFPQGLDYKIGLDTTRAVSEGMREISSTLWQALLLVILHLPPHTTTGTQHPPATTRMR